MYKLIDDFTLSINSKVLKFDYHIKNIVEFDKVYLILLWNNDSNNVAEQPLSNVYCINKTGDVLWNIKPIFENYNSFTDIHLFTQIEKCYDEKLCIKTFGGIVATIDPISGKILSKSWSK